MPDDELVLDDIGESPPGEKYELATRSTGETTELCTLVLIGGPLYLAFGFLCVGCPDDPLSPVVERDRRLLSDAC